MVENRMSHLNVLYQGMKHFAYVLYVEFDAQRNLCDNQNVLFYGTPRRILYYMLLWKILG